MPTLVLENGARLKVADGLSQQQMMEVVDTYAAQTEKPVQKEKGYFERVGENWKQGYQDIQNVRQKLRVGEFNPATGTFSAGIQAAEPMAEMAIAPISEAIVSGIRGLGNLPSIDDVPGYEKDPLNITQYAPKNVKESLLESRGGKIAKQAVEKGKQVYGTTKERFPEAVEDAEAALKVGLALSPFGLTKKSVPVVREISQIDTGLTNVLKRSEKSPDQILGELRSSKISTIADVGGESVRGATRALARDPAGKNIISDALKQRSEGAVGRVTSDLGRISKDEYFQTLDDVLKTGREKAKPLYDQAYSSNTSVASKEIDSILDSSSASRKALKEAAELMKRERSFMGAPDPELKALARDVAEIGKMDEIKGPIAKGLSLRTLDYVKRALDSQIETTKRTGADYRSLVVLKNDLKNELIRLDKTGSYKRALSESGDYLSSAEAMENGRNFSNLRPQEIQKLIKDMTPAERKAYRVGARESLQKNVYKTTDNADPAKRIFGNTEKKQQIRALFQNEDEFSRFSKRMNEEIRAADTKQAILGGSRTDFNVQDDGAFIDAASDLARNRNIKGAIIDRTIMAVADALKRRYYGINEANSKQIAKILTDRNQGIYELTKLIKAQKNQQQKEIVELIIDKHLLAANIGLQEATDAD